MKYLVFCEFLIVTICFVTFSKKWGLANNKKTNRDHNFIRKGLNSIATFLYLVINVFVVGQFFNLQMLLAVLAAAVFGIVLEVILRGLIGNPQVPYQLILNWALANFRWSYPAWARLIRIAVRTCVAIYFVFMSGLILNAFPWLDNTLWTLRATLGFIIILSGVLLPNTVSILGAPFIDEATRMMYLLQMSRKLIPQLVLVSFIWSLELDSVKQPLAQLSSSSFFSVVVMVFYCVFFLLPYFIGVASAKRYRSEDLAIRKSFLSGLTATINLPDDTAEQRERIKSALIELQKRGQDLYDKMMESSDSIRAGVYAQRPDAVITFTSKKGVKIASSEIIENFKKASEYDKRVNQALFLGGNFYEIQRLIDALDKKGKVARYSQYISNYQKIIDDEIAQKKTSPAIWVWLIAILSPIIAKLIGVLGDFVASYFKF